MSTPSSSPHPEVLRRTRLSLAAPAAFVLALSCGFAASGGTLLQDGGAQPAREGPDQDEFRQVQRPGSVDLDEEYNLQNLSIPRNQIHTLLPRDAIPALTDPALEKAEGAGWLPDDARVIRIAVGADVLGVPLRILDWHEVVNATVGGEPVAATYCPLCDSAAVFSRHVEVEGGGEVVLEFGVSGALYHSNVLMYDRRDLGLWSQLGMHAVSGPLAGTALTTLPVELIPFSRLKEEHPGASIVGRDTGHARDYTRSPYA
jgi:hypothetical protein